jgi:hypothetical protein
VHDSPELERLNALRTSRAGARRLVTADGTEWMVYEFPALTSDEHTTLVFESENVVRRLRMFPAEWRELSDRKLAGLCQEL